MYIALHIDHVFLFAHMHALLGEARTPPRLRSFRSSNTIALIVKNKNEKKIVGLSL